MNDCGLAERRGREGEAVGRRRGRPPPSHRTRISHQPGAADCQQVNLGDEFAKSSRLLCFAFRRAPGHIATVAAPTPQQQHALTCAIAANHSPEAVHRPAGTYSTGYSALLPTERPISPTHSPLTCPDQSARRKTPSPSNKPRSSMPTESIGHPTQSAGLSLADARSWCASSALISPLTTLTEPHARR